jgi:uncharacterized iron-regulated membrane protein
MPRKGNSLTSSTSSSTGESIESLDAEPDAFASLSARRRNLFWRIHFWAALIASPFALVAAFTGMLYIFTPQIETLLYRRLDQVLPSGTMRPLDEAIDAAKRAAPAGWTLHSVEPAYDASDTVKANFVPPVPQRPHHGDHPLGAMPLEPTLRPSFGLPAKTLVVYVNPYTAAVTGSLAYQERFSNWSKKLHSRLLQNDGWRWMIELAASWMMVMLLTGIYLWWPRGQPALPQAGARGRTAWKQWHGFIGVALAVMSLTILTTGLTWSKYAGGQIRALRNAVGQAPPQAPANLTSTPANGHAPLTWQAVWDAARQQAPAVPLQFAPPRNERGAWRIGSVDPAQPSKNFDMVLDAYSGQSIYYAGWDRQTAFSKATAIGIPFHRGEFGWWNQALLLMFGIGVVFSLVSGWVMFFKRRRTGTFGLPGLLPSAWKSMSPAMWIVAASLCVAMPLLAISAAMVLVLELVLDRSRGKSLRPEATTAGFRQRCHGPGNCPPR